MFRNLRFAISQKGVSGFFEPDGRWHGRLSSIALGLFGLDSFVQYSVAGLDLLRKAQVGERVFMRAIYLYGIGQGGQLVQRCNHLLRRPLKQPSAAARKQSIAAEQPWHFLGNIGDMAACMAGHIEHGQRQSQFGYRGSIAFAQWTGNLRNRFMAWAQYRNMESFQQLRHAADMVSMMMCQ